MRVSRSATAFSTSGFIGTTTLRLQSSSIWPRWLLGGRRSAGSETWFQPRDEQHRDNERNNGGAGNEYPLQTRVDRRQQRDREDGRRGQHSSQNGQANSHDRDGAD